MELQVLADIHGRLDALDTTVRLAREADDAATRAEHAERWARELGELIGLDPGYPAAYLRQGAWLEEAGDLAGAAAVYADGIAASGDPELHVRRVACLRAQGDEAGAEAGLRALIATPAGADDVRGHWQLAAAVLDRGDPLAAWERLSEYLEACPVRDAAELGRKLPALLLLLECAHELDREVDGLTAVAARFPGVDAEVLRACGRLRADPQAAGRLAEALRGDPYHAWGHYALAAQLARRGEEAAALEHLDVAMRGEPVLAWRARSDAAFAGLSVAPARDVGARCEVWVAEVEPEVRAGVAYLPVRTGSEAAMERVWWTLPWGVRGTMRPAAGSEDGPRFLRLLRVADRTPADYASLYRGLQALAPFVTHGRIFLREQGAGWIDEIRFEDEALWLCREALADGGDEACDAYFVARAEAAPDDPALTRLAAEVVLGSAQAHVQRFLARGERPEQPTRAGEEVDHAGAAARLLALALRCDPDNGGVWLQQGLLLRGQGDHAGARAAFERAVALRPASALPRMELGDQLRIDGDLAAAVEHYAAAVSLPDRPASLFHRLGLTLEGLGLLEDAIAAYDCSVELQPEHSYGSKLNRGNCCAGLQRWEEALASYALATAELPEQALAWIGRGQALGQLGRAAEAEEALRRAIALDAATATPWRELVSLHFGDAAQAVTLCDEALAREPDHAVTWSTKGSALNNLGRFAEAHACYERAIALDPNSWHAHYCQACTYALQGDREAALAAAARTVALEPAHKATLRAEADLASLRDDTRFIALVAD